ncbi:GNAT family N-acetyltransferase [Photobacterium sp. TY1-4]|uniref:GNAT family N-acetyltransferase n=1 Tax=Photobacterium sp. TY1-4 TaxID=2899122 RepID=UPI0021BF01AD|nr:GNAT family N-acetyltransferase [Photobacterium sp. TY1-4]UXI04184.1 GNAT family N-acetyltransferase [Photobacterium sp. TY1-4]
MEIRFGKRSDIGQITDIFNYYIEQTNARFESAPLPDEDRQAWFSQFAGDSKHQIFVAVENGKILGFACSQPYRATPAFEDTVEATIYLAPEARGKGLGSILYSKLLEALGNQGVHRVLSGVALPNDASLALHKRFGFREVGVFQEYAKKNDQYVSSMWLEKALDVEFP